MAHFTFLYLGEQYPSDTVLNLSMWPKKPSYSLPEIVFKIFTKLPIYDCEYSSSSNSVVEASRNVRVSVENGALSPAWHLTVQPLISLSTDSYKMTAMHLAVCV